MSTWKSAEILSDKPHLIVTHRDVSLHRILHYIFLFLIPLCSKKQPTKYVSCHMDQDTMPIIVYSQQVNINQNVAMVSFHLNNYDGNRLFPRMETEHEFWIEVSEVPVGLTAFTPQSFVKLYTYDKQDPQFHHP